MRKTTKKLRVNSGQPMKQIPQKVFNSYSWYFHEKRFPQIASFHTSRSLIKQKFIIIEGRVPITQVRVFFQQPTYQT